MKKIQYNSPVILTYVFLCCGVLLLDTLTHGKTTSLCFCVYRSSFSDPLTYVRMFGHVLGHSGWQHFFNNVLYLLIVGPAVEEKYGSRNLLIAMMVTAFVSGAAHLVLAPGSALLGASGIVFMLIFLASLSGMKKGLTGKPAESFRVRSSPAGRKTTLLSFFQSIRMMREYLRRLLLSNFSGEHNRKI